MNKIKWIEDKTNNHRANFDPMCFKLDNSNYIFCFDAYMSYKCFKEKVRKVAQTFNSKTVQVMEDWVNRKPVSNMTITGCDNFKFRIELDVLGGARREFKYYTIEEIFNN